MNRVRRPRARWRWAHRGAALLFLALLVTGAHAGAGMFRGAYTATTLLDTVPAADPLAALEVTLAARALRLDLVLGALLIAGAALLLGPFFCGWVCPLGLLLELAAGARARVLRIARKAPPGRPRSRPPRASRVLFLGLCLGFSLIAAVPAFQAISPVNLVSWVLVFFPLPALEAAARGTEATTDPSAAAAFSMAAAAAGTLLFLPAGILAVELLFPRLFCRAICPLGGLYSLLGSRAPLRVRPRAGAPPCPPACRRCTDQCPLGVAAAECFHGDEAGAGLADPACTRCGECADACPKGKLVLGFRGRSAGARPAGTVPREERREV